MHHRHILLSLLTLLLLPLAACRQEESQPETIVVPVSDAYGTLEENAVKLLVTRDGAVRTTLTALQEAGLPLDALSQETLSVTHEGEQVPYVIDGDGVVFFGRASDSRYSATRAYIIRSGEPGVLMETAAAGAGGSPAAEVVQQVTLEENRIYTSSARGAGSEDVWFWQVIQPGASMTISTTLPAVSAAPATLSASFYGASYDSKVELDHDLDVIVNGTPVGTIQWDGQTTYDATLVLPAGVLRSGLNEIRLDNSAPGATFVDIMQLNHITLSYTSPGQAIDDRLRFASSAGAVRLSGFSAAPRVFDLANPEQPRLLPVSDAGGGSYDVAVADGAETLAVGPTGYRQPAALLGLRSSSWTDYAAGADLIIISTDELLPAMDPLIAARRADGLRVAAVPLAEIYDEFGHGQESPLIIEDFIAHAYETWPAPAPRYLLVVGDATYDFRGYLGTPSPNMVPAPMIDVVYSGETISDPRLGDVDGDAIPELAVGRWPVTLPSQVEDLVARTLAYESGTPSRTAIFSADGTEAQFALISDRLVSSSSLDNADVARLYGSGAAEVTSAWNEGAWLVTYTGHGSLDKWGREDVLSQDAVADIRSTSTPPIVLQFTCLTGFFAHPSIQSLTESMMLSEDGPVLLLGASSLTLSTHQEPLAVNLLNALQNEELTRVGDALLAAKIPLGVENPGIREVSETFGLFGDPSARIVRPAASSG